MKSFRAALIGCMASQWLLISNSQGAIPDCGVVLGGDLKVEGRNCPNGELIAMEEGTVF
jgi:hypothetical protein